MDKLIEFRKSLIFKDNQVIFRDLDFELKKGENIAIIGSSASGKSAILKSLIGIFSVTNLFIKDTKIEKNIEMLYKIVAVVLNNSEIICDSVYSELAFSLKNLNMTEKEIKEKILSIADYFHFTELLDYDPDLLVREQKMLLRILAYLIVKPEVIALDNLFIYLNLETKKRLMTYLKEKGITLLLATSDIEDTLFVDYIYVLNEGKVIAEGKRDSIYTEEKLLNRIGYGLPFLIDMATQLNYYGIVDGFWMSIEELADEIWK